MFDLSTIRAKLTAAFGALTVLVVLIALLALQSLSAANQRFDRYVHGVNARAALAAQVRAAVDRRAIAARNLVLVTDPAHLAAEKAIVGAAHADVQKHLSALNKEMAEASDASDAARSLVGEITRVESAYGPVALAIVDLALSDRKPESIAKMNKECRPLLEALVDASQKYADLTQARAKEMIRHAEEEYALQRLILLAVCVAGFVAAVVAGVLIARSLGRALGAEPAELGVIAKRIADGDLRRLEVRAVPGSVLASLVVMQEGLAKIVGQVRGASNSIATGSAQIASGNADLSERTEQQASALQQTAATMAELDVTVRNNAGNASQASDLARGASAVAAQGGSVVAEVVATMKDINESSTRIAAIISVIDGIAFQTNILALNAAVEAARAGEQGRGFAVVAGEVRTLAQRSAEAAKEIKTLISASVDRVNTGSALVDRAGRTMSEIVSAIDRVTHVVGEISAASNEQSAGVSQVGEAVTQMDRATQSNAALVEESAAAAESLRQQAAQLVQAVAAFKLAESPC